MPLSPYFLQGSTNEQRLVQDLINEQLKIYGQDVVYLPRKIVNKNTIMKEVTASTFDDAFRMEAYLVNYEGFEGSGDVLSKFGIQTTDAVSFVISKERYEDFISPFLTVDTAYQLASRPEEGDLIYLPLDNTMFEIKYVEGKKPFYQLNNLYVYTLSCEVMDYALDEQIDTGIEDVDKAAVEFGFTTKLTMVGVSAATATATAQLAKDLSTLSTGNSVNRIDLINDGTGYTIAPLIGISTAPTDGINATAVAIMTSRSGQTGQSIDRIEITNPGYGYTEVPTITIRSQNAFGTGGIATALISPTSIGAPVITGGGSGYAFPSEISPTVTFTPPSSRATAIATVSSGSTVINALTITSPGVGYTGVPTVTISAPTSGVTAIATATVSAGGTITGLTINNAGTGYTSSSAPTVTISNEVGIKTWTGELAEAVSFLNTNGELNVIRYTNAGVGYTAGSAPEITISSPTKAGLSTGDYLFKEMVRGVSTGTTAVVSDWDRDTRVLKVTTSSGTFLTGETVVGIGTTMNGSDSQYVIQSKTDENDDDTFGDNLTVETEADAIIDFSEDNPFGDF